MLNPLFLVSHGSRDPRPQTALEQLANLVKKRQVSDLLPMVCTGSLEFHPLPLSEQIVQFVNQALAEGFNCVEILPLFLHKGVHLREDIPAAVSIARHIITQNCSEKISINLLPHLGDHPDILDLLKAKIKLNKSDIWILLAHGTRRVDGNQSIAEMAQKLGAIDAYLSVPPFLETRIQDLVQSEHHHVGIIPYFLFTGGITESIKQKINQLSEAFPKNKFWLAEPLGVSIELADLICDLRGKQNNVYW